MPLPLIAGNWKMYKTASQAAELLETLLPLIRGAKEREILICPPFTALGEVAHRIQKTSLQLGAQNLYLGTEGAFTGEVSGPMLKALGCTYVIVGHSERRQIFQETNSLLNQKLEAALQSGLRPIYCVGETLEERKKNQTLSILKTQIQEGLAGFSARELHDLVIAYEPVWAIGTGETATPEQAEEAHAYLRGLLSEKGGHQFAQHIRVLYGGSVKPENIDGLMAKPNINGALVGGASLSAQSFARIVNFSYNPVKV